MRYEPPRIVCRERIDALLGANPPGIVGSIQSDRTIKERVVPVRW